MLIDDMSEEISWIYMDYLILTFDMIVIVFELSLIIYYFLVLVGIIFQIYCIANIVLIIVIIAFDAFDSKTNPIVSSINNIRKVNMKFLFRKL